MGSIQLEKLSPLLNDLRQYKPEWLPADLIAGLSVAAVQVPTALAYAQLAGFSPEVGLYASMLPLLIYAFFASSRQLVIGPDAATCTMVASLVAPLATGDPDQYVRLSASLSIAAGLIMLIGGWRHMGFIVNFFARPILIGFLNGVALSIIAGQLAKVLGISIIHRDFIPSILEMCSRFAETHWPTLSVGAATLALLAIIKRISPRAPASLIALALAACGLHFAGSAFSTVALVGQIPSGLPRIGLPHASYHHLQEILVGSFGLVIVSFTSGMLTARSFAARSGQSINANREMWAIGTANIAAGLCGSFAVTGADSRTAVNTACGNKTQLSSIISAIAVALVITCFSKPLAFLPVSALAAVLIFSAIHLIDIKSYKELEKVDPFEFKLSILTTVGVLGLGVLPGVTVAISLALLIVLLRIYKPGDTLLGKVPGLEGYNDISLSAHSQTVPEVVVWRFEGPLVFFNADYFKTRLDEVIAATTPAPKYLVLSLESISQTDATGVKILETLHGELEAKEIQLMLARPKPYMRRLREHLEFVKKLGPANIFPTIGAAVESINDRKSGNGNTSHSYKEFYQWQTDHETELDSTGSTVS